MELDADLRVVQAVQSSCQRMRILTTASPHMLQRGLEVSLTMHFSGYRKFRLPQLQGSVEFRTCVTFIFIFCFGVRSPCLITASTQRSSSMWSLQDACHFKLFLQLAEAGLSCME